MYLIILPLALIALVFGPGLWVGAVMRRYSRPADRYVKTGGQVARELLDALSLQHVGTETTDTGDHYDPVTKTLRLSPANYDGRSLTALTVAAHEVGHAIQDARGFAPLRWRTRLVRWVGPAERIGAALLLFAPFSAGLTHLPMIGLASFAGGFLALGSGVVVHALTLPTEFDASFARALPLVRQRKVLRTEDLPHAHKLLTAAALTYVSGALTSLLNVARWWRILRRR